MNCFAQYRLPFANTYTKIEQTEGEVARLTSCTQLNGAKGFVVAPFQITDGNPILLIRPDRITTLPVEPYSLSIPIHYTQPTLNASEYAIDFANYHAQLENGTFRKIVLARTATIQLETPADAHQLFLKACDCYPRMFIALVAMPDGNYWLTATPEILLDGVGEQWRTIALAGTMQLQGEELNGEGETVRWSTKNIQEQRIVATYIAECLEQFSFDFHEEGPRTVRAAHLVHLRSDFTFTMSEQSRIGDLLQVLHPTPAVCGLPKRETFDFIVKNEHAPRQYYSGFMGPMGLDRETHLYVSLRCMQMVGPEYRLYAGGGLLKDSQLESEWQETEAKMQTMRNLLVS